MRILTSLDSIALTFGTIPGPFWLSSMEVSTQAFITIQFLVLCLYPETSLSLLSLYSSVCSLVLNLLWYFRFQFNMLARVTIGHCFLQEDFSAGVSLPFSICSTMVFQFSFSLSGPSSSGYFPGSSPLPHLDRFCSLAVFFSAVLTYIFSPGNFTHSHGIHYLVCF